MECSRSHDSEMVQHLYIGCSEGRVPAGGHLTPFWYPRPFLVPTLPGFQYTSVAPFWNRGTKSIPFLKRKWVILGAKKWLMGHLLLEHLKGWPLEGVLQKNFFFWKCPQWVNTQHISTRQLANWPKPNFRTAYWRSIAKLSRGCLYCLCWWYWWRLGMFEYLGDTVLDTTPAQYCTLRHNVSTQ